MDYFNSAISRRPTGVMTHMGDFNAAMARLDTIFSCTHPHAFDAQTIFKICGTEIVSQSPEDLLREFTDFVAQAKTFRFKTAFQKSLRLVDCWDDDPIGSGGMELFQGSTQISSKQMMELKTIFSPFTGIINPLGFSTKLSDRDIAKIAGEMKSNVVYRDELAKRKAKLGPKGFEKDKSYEIVWVAKTIKLRQWALANGYDSFVYDNTKEGGETYVSLGTKTIQSIEAYRFDGQSFFNDQVSGFADQLFKNYWGSKQNGSIVYDICWGTHAKAESLMAFWKSEKDPARSLAQRKTGATPGL